MAGRASVERTCFPGPRLLLAQTSHHIRPFPSPAAGVSSGGHFVMLLGVLTVSYNWLLFSMLSALVGEKTLFRPFVFKMFSALGDLPDGGHDVAAEFGGIAAGKVTSEILSYSARCAVRRDTRRNAGIIPSGHRITRIRPRFTGKKATLL